jgi:hypothetical protein
MRPVAQIKTAEMKYPTHTQIHACHQDRAIWLGLEVETMNDEAIIHVF